MTNEEKITMVKAMSDETDDTVISAFLTKAADELYKFADPYKTTGKETIVDEYADVQVDIAAYRLNKRGWDYESSHSENGVSRVYETGDLPASILRRITPIASSVS